MVASMVRKEHLEGVSEWWGKHKKVRPAFLSRYFLVIVTHNCCGKTRHRSSWRCSCFVESQDILSNIKYRNEGSEADDPNMGARALNTQMTADSFPDRDVPMKSLESYPKHGNPWFIQVRGMILIYFLVLLLFAACAEYGERFLKVAGVRIRRNH